MIYAENRSCTTQFELGQLFRKEETARDYDQAANWFLRSARKGYRKAQYVIGVMYARGTGVQQDYTRAYAWLKIAACQGSRKAARYLKKIAPRVPADQQLQAHSLARHFYQSYVAPFA
jgi:hypothetical protein